MLFINIIWIVIVIELNVLHQSCASFSPICKEILTFTAFCTFSIWRLFFSSPTNRWKSHIIGFCYFFTICFCFCLLFFLFSNFLQSDDWISSLLLVVTILSLLQHFLWQCFDQRKLITTVRLNLFSPVWCFSSIWEWEIISFISIVLQTFIHLFSNG